MIEHIGVVGISFCGSTLFNYILGQSPQVVALGESHWVVDDAKPNVCASCGMGGCPVWTMELQEKINKDNFHQTLHKQISEKFPEAKYIFHSNKNFNVYNRFKAFDYLTKVIVLYKRPEAHVCSMVRHYHEKIPENFEKNGYGYYRKKSMVAYASGYKTALTRITKQTKYMINLERFAENPEMALRRLCNKLGINYMPEMINFSRKSPTIHNIGGNAFMHRTVRGDEQVKTLCNNLKTKPDWYLNQRQIIKKDERWKIELSTQTIKMIRDDADINATWKKLESEGERII